MFLRSNVWSLQSNLAVLDISRLTQVYDALAMCHFTFHTPDTDPGNGYSLRDNVGEIGDRLSIETLGIGEAMILYPMPSIFGRYH